MNRFKDFDAAWAQSEKLPLSAKVFGKTYELPASLPAKVVILMARLKRDNPDPKTEVPPDKMIELLEPFFGVGVLETWADAGLDVDQMGEVFSWALAMYSGEGEPSADGKDEGEDEGN